MVDLDTKSQQLFRKRDVYVVETLVGEGNKHEKIDADIILIVLSRARVKNLDNGCLMSQSYDITSQGKVVMNCCDITTHEPLLSFSYLMKISSTI